MQPQGQQMSLLETLPPAGTAPAWTGLDEQQRTEVVQVLARLIAKVADGQRVPYGSIEEEERHD
jgi:hypothetical protein